MPKLPNKIRELREKAGLSQAKLAQKIHPPTSYQQIDRLEKGMRRLTMEWAYTLADALGVHPTELMPDHAPPPPLKGAVKQAPSRHGPLRESQAKIATAELEFLDKLNDMRKRKIITQAEYKAQKKKVFKE
jgi:transcriptional regulator with XRE-family HTH domain